MSVTLRMDPFSAFLIGISLRFGWIVLNLRNGKKSCIWTGLLLASICVLSASTLIKFCTSISGSKPIQFRLCPIVWNGQYWIWTQMDRYTNHTYYWSLGIDMDRPLHTYISYLNSFPRLFQQIFTINWKVNFCQWLLQSSVLTMPEKLLAALTPGRRL